MSRLACCLPIWADNEIMEPWGVSAARTHRLLWRSASHALEKSFARRLSSTRFAPDVFDPLHRDHSNYAGLPQRLKASFVLEALFPSRVIAF
jgi:hypothetical protein